MGETYLTSAQAAELVRTSADRIRDLIASGELEAVNIGAKGSRRATWRIAEAALERWLASRSTVSRSKPTPRRRKPYVGTYY